MHKLIKELQQNGQTFSNGIKSKNGKLLYREEEIMERWLEYGKELYEISKNPNQRIMNEEDGLPILKEEIKEAMKKIIAGKANGIDNLPIEFFKNMNEEALNIITELVNGIYMTGAIPDDFKKTVMIPLPKKKHSTDCSDHRTISIITHASKILLEVILRRIRRKIEENIGEDQYGFRANKGTRDGIMELNIIAQKAIKDHKTLYIGFVDFEKAFDRVDHGKLLEMLKKIGIDGKDLQIIRNLYQEQKAAFKIKNKFTEWFNVNCGVRQGCKWSPSFFNLYSEEIIKEALDGTKGILIGGTNFNRIRYADDVAVLA